MLLFVTIVFCCDHYYFFQPMQRNEVAQLGISTEAIAQVKEIFAHLSDSKIASILASFDGNVDRTIEYMITTPDATTLTEQDKYDDYVCFLTSVDQFYFSSKKICNKSLHELEGMLDKYFAKKMATSVQQQQVGKTLLNQKLLPKEVLHWIFHYLELDLVFLEVRLVCKYWNDTCLDDTMVRCLLVPPVVRYRHPFVLYSRHFMNKYVSNYAQHVHVCCCYICMW